MRVVLQRVSRAQVSVGGTLVGSIEGGLCLLVGIGEGDDESGLSWMAEKICGLRIFRDEEGLMNRSLKDVGGAILAISQFTLYGDCKKGKRPSFMAAARPEVAEPLFERFLVLLRERVEMVETGIFGATMAVEIVNDGPVTLVLER